MDNTSYLTCACRPSTWMTLGAAKQWQFPSAFHWPLAAFHTCHFLRCQSSRQSFSTLVGLSILSWRKVPLFESKYQECIARVQSILRFCICNAIVSLVLGAGHKPLSPLRMVPDQHIAVGIVGIPLADASAAQTIEAKNTFSTYPWQQK